jgi:hypothetical protein
MTGMRGHIGLGEESVWGTAVAVTDYVEALSESLTTTIERFDTVNIAGGFQEPDDQDGLRRHAGDIVAPTNADNVPFFLKGALGVQSETIVGSHLFQYEYTPTTTLVGSLNPLQPFTFEIFRPGGTDISSSFRYAGCQVAGLTFGIAPNQDIRMTASLIAKAQTQITKTTATFPGSPVAPFVWDTVSVSIAGTAVARVEALTIGIQNQLEGIPSLNNSDEIAKIRRNGPVLVSIDGQMELTDLEDFQNFKNQTEQQIIVSATRANSFFLEFDIPRAIFTEYPVNIGGRDRVVVGFSMKGRYHTGSASSIKATITTTNTL